MKGTQWSYFPPGKFFPQDYELEAEKLRSILDLENGRNGYTSKKPRLQSPAAKVKEEVNNGWPTMSYKQMTAYGTNGDFANSYIYCCNLGPRGDCRGGQRIRGGRDFSSFLTHHFFWTRLARMREGKYWI